MTALLRVLSGARVGHVLTSDGSPIHVGREAGVELRFDPDRDLEVSGRHAVLAHENGAWWLTDTGSRNGTFVNGQRVERATPLRDGDELMFGAGGPRVEFRSINRDATRDFPLASTQPVAQQGPSHTAQIRTHKRVAKQWQLIAVGSVLLLSAVVGLLALNTRRERESWERERAALLAQRDSAVTAGDRAIAALKGDLAGLADALRASQSQVREIGGQLERARRNGDGARLTTLRSQLQGAIATLNTQQAAANLDHDAIRRANDKAVAKIYTEMASGEVSAGTAFAVRSDATFVTNRHLVQDADGTPSRRLAVQFAHSDQVWPARVLAIDQEHDLAIIKVDAILGDVPTVQRLGSEGEQGAPVMMIGFPLGGESMPSERAGRSYVKPVTGAGVIAARSAKLLEITGYGATGSSGSPVFNARGEVIGIVFGGRGERGNHQVVAVPSTLANRLLGSIK